MGPARGEKFWGKIKKGLNPYVKKGFFFVTWGFGFSMFGGFLAGIFIFWGGFCLTLRRRGKGKGEPPTQRKRMVFFCYFSIFYKIWFKKGAGALGFNLKFFLLYFV